MKDQNDMQNKIYTYNITELDDCSVYKYWYEKMDSSRRKKIDAFKFDNGKKLSLGAGILLHKALGELGITDYEIELKDREKPYIKGHEDIFYNLSHSGNMAALAISDKEIGIDIENIRHFESSLINYVFTESEKKLAGELTSEMDAEEINTQLEALNSDHVSDSSTKKSRIKLITLPDLIYTRFWTAKESIMKHSGHGIALEPKKIQLSRADYTDSATTPHELLPRLHATSDSYNCSTLTLTSLRLPDYQLTICSSYPSDAFIITI